MMFENEGFPITHCGAGINAFSINPNGDVFPCVKISDENSKITNMLMAVAISDIHRHREYILNNELVDSKRDCCQCDIKYFCGGGCRAEETNEGICSYNCNYFHSALGYYAKKLH